MDAIIKCLVHICALCNMKGICTQYSMIAMIFKDILINIAFELEGKITLEFYKKKKNFKFKKNTIR